MITMKPRREKNVRVFTTETSVKIHIYVYIYINPIFCTTKLYTCNTLPIQLY